MLPFGCGCAMTYLRKDILNCLSEYADDDVRLISTLDGIIEKNGENACAIILNILINTDIPPENAVKYWREIIAHHRELSNVLQRKVSLRTAICDYFSSIKKTLNNSMFIDIRVFEEKIKSLNRDSLTGLYNRGYLDDLLKREFARTKRHDIELSLLFFDIDNFKNINDLYGHLAGDLCLKKICAIILDTIREEDIAVRYGGEEILGILPQTNKSAALAIGERIRERIGKLKIGFDGRVIFVTVSGGIATFPEDASEPMMLLKHADIALYLPKKAGKNRISVYTGEKRNYIRIDFIKNIEIKKQAHADIQETFKARSKDLSMGGILFETCNYLQLGTKIQLTIPAETTDKAVKVEGIVVRIEALDAEKYDVGISFLEMGEMAKNEISRCIGMYAYSFYGD